MWCLWVLNDFLALFDITLDIFFFYKIFGFLLNFLFSSFFIKTLVWLLTCFCFSFQTFIKIFILLPFYFFLSGSPSYFCLFSQYTSPFIPLIFSCFLYSSHHVLRLFAWVEVHDLQREMRVKTKINKLI